MGQWRRSAELELCVPPAATDASPEVADCMVHSWSFFFVVSGAHQIATMPSR